MAGCSILGGVYIWATDINIRGAVNNSKIVIYSLDYQVQRGLLKVSEKNFTRDICLVYAAIKEQAEVVAGGTLPKAGHKIYHQQIAQIFCISMGSGNRGHDWLGGRRLSLLIIYEMWSYWK